MALPALLLTATAAAAWTVDAATEGVLFEDHRVPVVTVVVDFPAGDWSGWARAVGAPDAFTFQDDDPGRVLRRRIDALGVSIDLEVDRRSSTVRVTSHREQIEPALALVREILANRRYDVWELKRARRERQVLWRLTRTDVAFRLAQEAARELFDPDDPRRRTYEKPPPLETDPEALIEARDRLVRLPRRLVGFAGDLTREDAVRLAEGLLPPAVDPPEGVEPELLALRPVGERARGRSIPIPKLTQVYLACVRESVPWNDPRRAAFLVADHALGGHFYARLLVALRHEDGQTYGAGTREDGDVAAGVYRISTFTRADNAAAIEAKLVETLRAFRERGLAEEERATAVSALSGRRAFARQSPAQLLARYRLERRVGLPAGAIDATVDRAATLSLDEINAFVREYYDPARYSILRAVPE